jgi:predicted HicB family RNase H-like nuclease
MAISKAQQKAVNKYVRENYDRVNVNMPKGKKDDVQAHAAHHGISVNAYINAAIDEKMERDNTAAE